MATNKEEELAKVEARLAEAEAEVRSLRLKKQRLIAQIEIEKEPLTWIVEYGSASSQKTATVTAQKINSYETVAEFNKVLSIRLAT